MAAVNNPYVSAAADFAASAPDATRMAQALRAAAAQQQQLQQKQLQQQFSDELKMRKDGYTPYMQTTGQTSSGLKTRDAQPGVDPSRVIADPWGRKWVAPDGKATTPAQMQTATHENTDDLLKALKENSGQIVSPAGTVFQMGDVPRLSMNEQGNVSNTGRSGVNVAPQHPELVQNVGGRQVYLPSEGERAQDELRRKVNETSGVHTATQDAESWTLPDELAAAAEQHAGLPKGSLRGVKLPREIVADAFKSATTRTKPDASQIVPGLAGPNGGLVVFDKDKQTTAEVPVPKGARRELTPAQVEARTRADERAAEAERKVIETLQGKQEKLAAEAAQYHDLADQYQSQIGAANGEKYIDPMDKSRTARIVNAQTRTALGQGYMRAKTKADAIDKQAAALGQQVEARRSSGRGKATETPAAAPAAAAPGQTAPAGKKATLEQVRAYAQANQLSESEAVRKAIEEGYTITRPARARR